MVVLNIQGKIPLIRISKKLGLWISNLPNEELNNWNEYLCSELYACLRRSEINQQKLGIKQRDNLREMYERYFPNMPISKEIQDEDKCIQAVVNRMICIYFDYEYDDMPMGDWTTNCFDGRLCEEDYAEKIIDFINFASKSDDDSLPSPIPQWIYSSNHDEANDYRLFWGGQEADPYIANLIEWGRLFDNFLLNRNDYLQLDYLMNSIHKDNGYNENHLMKAYSLCQLFLENEKEIELDFKLPYFIEGYSDEERNLCAKLLRRLRNKLAHGDFIGFEAIIEEYASSLMDGCFQFDYSEYSRKNWTILHVCCLLDEVIRRLIETMLLDRDRLQNIKQSKLPNQRYKES